MGSCNCWIGCLEIYATVTPTELHFSDYVASLINAHSKSGLRLAALQRSTENGEAVINWGNIKYSRKLVDTETGHRVGYNMRPVALSTP